MQNCSKSDKKSELHQMLLLIIKSWQYSLIGDLKSKPNWDLNLTVGPSSIGNLFALRGHAYKHYGIHDERTTYCFEMARSKDLHEWTKFQNIVHKYINVYSLPGVYIGETFTSKHV